MKYFCLDTSGSVTAVCAAGEKKVHREDDGFVRASRSLMPMLDDVLKEAGMSASDADFIGVVTGPGSFTGVRIGVSAARSLGYALNIPIVPVNSCELAAYNSRCSGRVLTVSDAGNGFVYTALYDGFKQVLAPSCIRVSELSSLMESVGNVEVAADKKCAEILKVSPVTGEGLAEFAESLFKERQCRYSEVVPVYVRKSQAEEGNT